MWSEGSQPADNKLFFFFTMLCVWKFFFNPHSDHNIYLLLSSWLGHHLILTIVSHLDFCNDLLTALPILVPLTVHHPPYSQSNFSKVQMRLKNKILVCVFNYKGTETLVWAYTVLQDTVPCTLSNPISCHSPHPPTHLFYSWTHKIIPASWSLPSIFPLHGTLPSLSPSSHLIGWILIIEA